MDEDGDYVYPNNAYSHTSSIGRGRGKRKNISSMLKKPTTSSSIGTSAANQPSSLASTVPISSPPFVPSVTSAVPELSHDDVTPRNHPEEFLLSELIDDAVLSVLFETHRLAKTGQLDASMDPVDRPGCDIFGAPQTSLAQAGNAQCTCMSCNRIVVASRFAPHLEKCLGLGRQSSRVAARRIAQSNDKPSRSAAANDADDTENTDSYFTGSSQESSSAPTGAPAVKKRKKDMLPMDRRNSLPLTASTDSNSPIHPSPSLSSSPLSSPSTPESDISPDSPPSQSAKPTKKKYSIPPKPFDPSDYYYVPSTISSSSSSSSSSKPEKKRKKKAVSKATAIAEAMDWTDPAIINMVFSTCAVVSTLTGKMCTKTLKCPQHNDDQRNELRRKVYEKNNGNVPLLLLGQSATPSTVIPSSSGYPPSTSLVNPSYSSYPPSSQQALPYYPETNFGLNPNFDLFVDIDG